MAVAERLSLENATLVSKTHGHLMPDSEQRTRAGIDGAWEAAVRHECAIDGHRTALPSAAPFLTR